MIKSLIHKGPVLPNEYEYQNLIEGLSPLAEEMLVNYVNKLDDTYKYILHVICPFEIKEDIGRLPSVKAAEAPFDKWTNFTVSPELMEEIDCKGVPVFQRGPYKL